MTETSLSPTEVRRPNSLAITDLDLVATFDDRERVLKNATIVIEDGSISSLSRRPQPAKVASTVIDGRGKLALPGFINTHHHFFQQLTRAHPAVHTASLLEWLRQLYPVWSRLDEGTVYAAARLAIAQLLKTGCTTTSDMSYLIGSEPQGMFDATVRAARELGIRLHPIRSALLELEAGLAGDLAEAGIAPASLVENRDAFLEDCDRVVTQYHDPGPFSMCRVGLGLTEKAYHDPQFMRRLADIARSKDLLLHAHLHPRPDEVALCQELHGLGPLSFLEEVGWLGAHLWLAHGTNLTPADIQQMAKTNTGLSHSPASNMRLGLRAAPLPQLLEAGVRVGIGVDGGASNDGGSILGELRLALLVHRILGIHAGSPGVSLKTTPYEVLAMGTRGGASILRRPDLGSLEPGKAADIVLYDLSRLEFAGAADDPVAALLLTGEGHSADTVIVQGNVVLQAGRLVSADEELIATEARTAAASLRTPGV